MRSIITLAILCAIVPGAWPCSCISGAGPACEEAWSKYTSAVFLGKVTEIHIEGVLTSFVELALGRETKGLRNRVEFEIEESFLGVSGKKVTLWTNASGPSCGYKFVQGEHYVVYAGKDDNQLYVSLCSHTRLAKDAKEDIVYFHSLSSLPSSSTIQGSLWRYTHDPNFKPKSEPTISDHYRPPEQDYMAMEPVSGVTVVAKGPDGMEHSTEVGPDGNWQISNLAPGSYTVAPKVKDQLFVHSYRDKVEVAAKGCARLDMRVENNGRIAGELTHGPRQPDWAVLTVFALPADQTDLRQTAKRIYLEMEKSSFELAPLPAGKYIIGAYLSKQVEVKPGVLTFHDAAPTYYPGVLEPSKAVAIEVHDGERSAGVNFPLLDIKF